MEVFALSVKKAAEAIPNVLLRKARQERGWSQRELADLIGVTQSFMISRWENGTVCPRPNYQEKLISVFGKCYEELGLHKPASLFLTVESRASIFDPAIPMRQPGAPTLIGRSPILDQIEQSLCSQVDGTFIGISGLPGVGKTALAMELSTAAEIQDHFQDGVLWATLGPRPNVCAQLRRWGSLLGIRASETSSIKDYEIWAWTLRQAIGARRMLLILDDVWSIEDALAYMVGGPHCAYFLTTRIPEVAIRFAGKQALQLSELAIDDGVQLLAQIVPTLVEKERDLTYKLVQAAGGLPLTLTLMGNYLLIQMCHRQQRRIQSALRQLQLPEGRMQLTLSGAGSHYNQRLPPGMPLSIQAIISSSEALLDETSRQALYALSVFPAKPAAFSEEAALAVLAASRDVLDQLVDAGLIECNEEGCYQIHQSIVDYARTRNRNTPANKQRSARLPERLEIT